MAVDLPQPGLTHAAPDPASSPPPGLSAGRGGRGGVRIGINGYFLREPWTGMGNHLSHLLTALDARGAGDEQYNLLVPRFPGEPPRRGGDSGGGDGSAQSAPMTDLGPLTRRFSMTESRV